MRVAFYAPLKSPNHAVPSGDRLMARLLIQALETVGHVVEVVSEFRNYAATPDAAKALEPSRQAEFARIRDQLATAGAKPDLWFCYHPYYKSPDPFGPILSAELAIPYVTVEASYSPKRDASDWAASQRLVADALRQASVNIAMTERDRLGVEKAISDARVASLKPFIDTMRFERRVPQPDPGRLVTVAMMRPGDKLESYRMLAAALHMLDDAEWTFAIIGDGPQRADVEALFAGFEPGRIEWFGERNPDDVAALLSRSGIYVWPGCGEAYGLAYLEAQAAGLPAIAQRTAGVPAVIENGVTGLLTAEGDVQAYASAIRELLNDHAGRQAMGDAARRFVFEERSLGVAARTLDGILTQYTGGTP